VTIIELNWDGGRDTIKGLESLQQITYLNYQTIVVDSGSTNDSAKELKHWTLGEDFVDASPETLASVQSHVSLEIIFLTQAWVAD
jgi:hypothetical protein